MLRLSAPVPLLAMALRLLVLVSGVGAAIIAGLLLTTAARGAVLTCMPRVAGALSVDLLRTTDRGAGKTRAPRIAVALVGPVGFSMVRRIMSPPGTIGRLGPVVAPMCGVAWAVGLPTTGTPLALVAMRARAIDQTLPDTMTGRLRLPVGLALVGVARAMADLAQAVLMASGAGTAAKVTLNSRT